MTNFPFIHLVSLAAISICYFCKWKPLKKKGMKTFKVDTLKWRRERLFEIPGVGHMVGDSRILLNEWTLGRSKTYICKGQSACC